MSKNRISQVTTRVGDSGQTKLATGRTVQKSGQYVTTVGTVDELNSHIGMALSHIQNADASSTPLPDDIAAELVDTLKTIQQDLFDMGAVLAMEGAYDAPSCNDLETVIATINAALPPLTEFVLPGGNLACAQLHICRTVCRRTEAQMWSLIEETAEPPAQILDCARFLNRLSDFFFVAARRVNDADEEQWQGPAER